MLISLICDHGSSGIGAHSRNRSHIAGCMRVTPLSHAAHEDLEQCSRAAAAVWERPEAARAWRMESGEGDRPEGPGVRSGSTMGPWGITCIFQSVPGDAEPVQLLPASESIQDASWRSALGNAGQIRDSARRSARRPVWRRFCGSGPDDSSR